MIWGAVQEMRADRDRILRALQRRMARIEFVLCALTLAWVVVVGLTLLSQMTPEDMANHRSQVIHQQILSCGGDFAHRYDCTQQILLSGERQGILDVAKRIALTLLLPAVAWAVWWSVLRRIRQIYWLPPPVRRFRSFA
jgi:hypothetical protein